MLPDLRFVIGAVIATAVARRHAVRPRGDDAHFLPEQDRSARSVAHARLHVRGPASHLRDSGAALRQPVRQHTGRSQSRAAAAATGRAARAAGADRRRGDSRCRSRMPPAMEQPDLMPTASVPPAAEPACRAARKPAAAGRRCRHGGRARGRSIRRCRSIATRRRRPRNRTGRAIAGAGAASRQPPARRSKRYRLHRRRC